jgi:hypothetical protein
MVLEKYEMLYEMKWVKLAHTGSIMSPEGLGKEGNRTQGLLESELLPHTSSPARERAVTHRVAAA